MSSITRTIQQDQDSKWVDNWFTAEPGERSFPNKGEPQETFSGDCLYLIYRGNIVGRFLIKRFEWHLKDHVVGSSPTRVEIRGPHCDIVVRTPGVKSPKPIPRRGHQGIRYDDVPEWPCQNETTISRVNEAVRLSLAEDAEDLAAFEERAGELDLAFEDVLKDLKKRGRI